MRRTFDRAAGLRGNTMNVQEYNHLRAEQTALQRMLATIPEENVLDRSGLAARLEEIAEQLDARFRDVAEVRNAVERLSQDNLREEEITLHGEFQGLLPNAGEFEFKLSVNGEVIQGKIGPAISNPHVINQHLHRATTISVAATQVGKDEPRYMLLASPSWE